MKTPTNHHRYVKAALGPFAPEFGRARPHLRRKQERGLQSAAPSLLALLLPLALLLASAGGAGAAVHYVDANGVSPTAPYTDWRTAAATIQQAVDIAAAGDEIVVTNGIYATGGRAVDGTLTNRVAVDKALTVRSVNGPAFTLIQGYQLAGTPNGDGAIRCVYLAKGAVLSGFTCTNGATRTVFENAPNRQSSGGGVWCEYRDGVVITNCVITGNAAPYYGAGVAQGTLHQCTLTGNLGIGAFYSALNDCQLTANSGTGADSSTLNGCTLTGNSGSGAHSSTLNNCMVRANSSVGADSCTLHNCTLTGNSGFGASSSTLVNCIVKGNSGTGAYSSTLINCALIENSGSGSSSSTLNNCTVVGNAGGGAFVSSLTNCIVYFNTSNQSANYDSWSTFNHCCTTPQPTNGTGNFSVDPQLASSSHLSAVSPCRGAGNPLTASGTDIDGEAWASPPSVGCDEYRAGAATGLLSASISSSLTNALPGFTLNFKAAIEAQTSGSTWDFGDGITVTNQPYASHSWTAPGEYLVVLRAFNDSQPEGVRASVTVHIVAQAIYYVAAENPAPLAPYTSWATAATNIQDAVDGASVAGALVMITNGIYATGGRDESRVMVDKPLSLQSVNGPQFTIIDGGNATRCVSLKGRTSLTGFTLTNGFARSIGGGLWCDSVTPVVSNCVLSGNRVYAYADQGEAFGGGAYGGTLNHCTLNDNYSETLGVNMCQRHCPEYVVSGDGAYASILNDCTLSGNWGAGARFSTLNNCLVSGNYYGGAFSSTLRNCALVGNGGGGAFSSTLQNCSVIGNAGGGAFSSTLHNCLVYFNTAQGSPNYDASSTLTFCCTTPLPASGAGNISSLPQLVDAWHLSASSPCLGAGEGADVSGTDLDGEPWATPPAIGCDEFHPGARTGPLSVSLTASLTNVAAGFAVQLSGSIQGRASRNSWDFGDGTSATNQPAAAHSWAAPGDYDVVLGVFNDSQPGVTSASLTIHVVNGVHYVASDSPNPLPPYNSWSTAATSIQAAIDAALAPGSQVWVTNGIYSAVSLHSLLSVTSVNGAVVTIINGQGATPCARLPNDAVLSGFTLINGQSDFGAGASGGTLNNCILTANSALANGYGYGGAGGGANGCTLNSCALFGNSALGDGGGAYYCTLNHCTVIANSSAQTGGGTFGCTLHNSIVYFNHARLDANYDASSTLNYCCATPQPTNGLGNISVDPQLASTSHLSSLSPCRGAGDASFSGGTDLDGEPWSNPPSIGCDEFQPGAVTGPLTVAMTASFRTVPVGLPVEFRASIQGRTTASVWTFADGTGATNQPVVSHIWTAPGDYAVGLIAYNESQPGGVGASAILHVVEQPIHYVAADSPSPLAPFTSWSTAARNIQDAIDAASVPSALVLVTNGTYALGGRLAAGATTRAVIDKLLTLRSINGPQFTVIDGGRSARCVYLANGAALAGFTLTNGTATTGGGIFCAALTEVVSNCWVMGNSAPFAPGFEFDSSPSGGGASGGTLNHCTLAGNTAAYYGGGASSATLNNCILTANSATASSAAGGGAWNCTLNDCILTANSGFSAGGASACTLNRCTLTSNSADHGGGGADTCTLNNCTLRNNSAPNGGGGGACDCTLNNCVLTGNSAARGGASCYGTLNNCTLTGNSSMSGDNMQFSTLNNCILFQNTSGDGSQGPCDAAPASLTLSANNWCGDPLFVDYANGNLRLQSNSPCINSGFNAWASSGPDLDGNPRIAGGTVDLGAYEFQTPASLISYAWLQQFRLPTDGSADTSDPDGDGLNNWQEWRSGTDPTNPLSTLRLLPPLSLGTNILVSWPSFAGVTYFLERASQWSDSPAFAPLVSKVAGQPGTTTYADTNVLGRGAVFYRLGIEN